jgi:hypothetical protein
MRILFWGEWLREGDDMWKWGAVIISSWNLKKQFQFHKTIHGLTLNLPYVNEKLHEC